MVLDWWGFHAVLTADLCCLGGVGNKDMEACRFSRVDSIYFIDVAWQNHNAPQVAGLDRGLPAVADDLQ